MIFSFFSIQAYFRQGVALQYLGRHADALAAFASGLAQDPKSLQLLVGMVEAAMKSPLRGRFVWQPTRCGLFLPFIFSFCPYTAEQHEADFICRQTCLNICLSPQHQLCAQKLQDGKLWSCHFSFVLLFSNPQGEEGCEMWRDATDDSDLTKKWMQIWCDKDRSRREETEMWHGNLNKTSQMKQEKTESEQCEWGLSDWAKHPLIQGKLLLGSTAARFQPDASFALSGDSSSSS